MVVHTEKRKISEIKKGINKLKENKISIAPNIDLEDLVEDIQMRIFVNQLIAMTTDMSERKNYKLAIVLEYGNKKLSKSKERKLENIIEQMTHQLEFTEVMLVVQMPETIPLEAVNCKLMENTKNLNIARTCIKDKSTWEHVM